MPFLVLAALLLGGAQPEPQPVVPDGCAGELLRAPVEGVRLVSTYVLSTQHVDLEFIVQAMSRRRTARRLTEISVELRGQVEAVTSPPGWASELNSRVVEGTVIALWRPMGAAASRRMIGSTRGFRVRLRGPNAGVGCTLTLAVDGGGVGSGCAS